MKKLVPDPPQTSSLYTTHTPFGSSAGHPPLFAVCAGAEFRDALTHLSASLTSAAETNLQLSELVDQQFSDLAWATQQSLEMSQALVMSMLNTVIEQGRRQST
ncbi:hypothetical protein [Pseudomonas huaxiensis]|uniref:hypothetical protein n=1 Tax=Pseudomonas huaxiensis TaxID=2213017 RepID=UPI000DA6D585|nr:hypothetical protein [Pseudomonas huaxiensis]